MNFVKIDMNTPNIVYYMILYLNVQYELSATLNLVKVSSVCIEKC
jgi:hypothetical protein